MKRDVLTQALFWATVGLLLVACGGPAPADTPAPDTVATAVAATLTAGAPTSPSSPTPDVVATEVAAELTRITEETAVAATPTTAVPAVAEVVPTDTPLPPAATETEPPPPPTDAPPSQPTDTPPPPPTDTPPPPPADTPPQPTPTPTTVREARVALPVDGGGGDVPNIRNDNPVKGGRNVTLPGYSQDEVSAPMVFRDRIVFQAEVFDANAGTGDGDGIENVQFTIADDRGRQVHFRQENQAGYCVFGGGEPDCNVVVFADAGYRWPDGETFFPVTYNVTINIKPYDGETVTWVWSFDIALPHDSARIDDVSVQDDLYVVDFETFGFTPRLPGQHLHFFFGTVPPEQAGQPGQGPWVIYGGASPFTGYTVAERPPGATRMCVLVANEDHSVQLDTGNCVALP